MNSALKTAFSDNISVPGIHIKIMHLSFINILYIRRIISVKNERNKKMKNIKISFIGGDLRQLAAARTFSKKGADTQVFGFDGFSDGYPGVKFANDLGNALINSACVVLPLPYGRDGKINCPMTREEISLDDVIKYSGNSLIVGGRLDPKSYETAFAHNNKMIDYYGREELSVLNAVPTAEGAIEIAMRELPLTIFGMEAAVIGYGRVGRVLARTLSALGANVTVLARKADARAWARVDGCACADIERLADLAPRFICVFNTVPAPVIGAKTLVLLPAGALVIDLASSPGGVDFGAAEKAGVRCISALSLPGRVAPDTAGMIIAETIENILMQEEII